MRYGETAAKTESDHANSYASGAVVFNLDSVEPIGFRERQTVAPPEASKIIKANLSGPPILQMAGHGEGHLSRRTANNKLTKLY